jgi:SAM-dependent methyltransferase
VASARDLAIAADVRDVIAHDCRLADLALDIEVRGGVVHLAGVVGSPGERRLVRQVVGRVRGVLAVWALLEVAGAPLRAIDIGAGDVKQHRRAIGLDLTRRAAVDAIVDLRAALPLATDSVDVVFAVHVLEHIPELLSLMHELHRVLGPQGVLHVIVPHWRFVNAVADPTHVRFFDAQTFKYFCQPAAGRRIFSPLAVASTEDNVYADLEAVKEGNPVPTTDALARFFN